MKKWLSNISKRTWVRIALITVFFVILGFSLAGEKVAKDNGIGWDGENYLKTIQHFTELITTHGYDEYAIQRIMPWGLVNIVFQVCNIEPTPHNALVAGGVLNVLALVLAIFFFFKISSLKKWKLSTEVIAFASLFYSYALLKIPGYYILLSDTFGFLWGLMMLYLFLADKRWWLLLVAILGAVNWPGVALICGLVLVFLPRKELKIEPSLAPVDRVGYNLVLWGLALSPLLFQIAAYCMTSDHHFMMWRDDERVDPIPIISFWFGVLGVCAYLWYMMKPFKISLTNIFRDNCTWRNWLSVLLIAICYVGVMRGLTLFTNHESGALNNSGLLKCIFVSSTTDPLCFIESFFCYFGPVVLLWILLWQKSARYVVNNGVGFFFVIALAIFFSLRPEARVSIMFVPFIALPIVEYIDTVDLKKWVAPVYAVSAIILSHVWYPINVEGMDFALSWENSDHYIDFPAQRYFMCTGHWQSHETYYVWMGITIVVGLILYLGMKKGLFTYKAQND